MDRWFVILLVLSPMALFHLGNGIWTGVELAQDWNDPCHTFGDKDNPSVLTPTPECPSVSSESTTKTEALGILLLINGIPLLVGSIAVWGAWADRPWQVAAMSIPFLIASFRLFSVILPLIWLPTGIALLVATWWMWWRTPKALDTADS